MKFQYIFSVAVLSTSVLAAPIDSKATNVGRAPGEDIYGAGAISIIKPGEAANGERAEDIYGAGAISIIKPGETVKQKRGEDIYGAGAISIIKPGEAKDVV